MPQSIITPWRDNSELIKLRAQLYSSSTIERHERRKAINLVGAWKLRGNLPHTVESTALLCDAVLNDDTDKVSIYSIRATYSTAFCRFVTGLLDNGQTGPSKVSMFQMATRIGLPKSFVELRHEATHGELPALFVLRQAATRSLSWLWQYYWKTIDERNGSLSDIDCLSEQEQQQLKEGLQELLRHYRSDRVEAAKSAKGDPTSSTILAFKDKLNALVQELIKLINGREATMKEIIKVLLETKYLIPANRILGDSIDNAWLIWDDFLMELTNWQPTFLRTLVEKMTVLLVQPSKLDIKFDTYREAIYLWLVHILTSPSWAAGRSQHPVFMGSVITTCLSGPDYWSLKLAALLVTTDRDVQDRYGEVVQLALQPLEHDLVQPVEREAIRADLQRYNAALDNDFISRDRKMNDNRDSIIHDPLLCEAGWSKWKGPWASKPIGVID